MSKSKCITKRLLAVVLTVLMLMSMVTIGMASASAATVELAETGANIAAGTKLYLKPNSNWKKDGARFAAYFFGNGDAWVSMTKVEDETAVYEVTSPSKSFTNVIFCRMNPASTTNDWTKDTVFWNQTNDLTYDGTNNCYTVAEGAWSNGGGSWSIYTAPDVDDDIVTGEFFADVDGDLTTTYDVINLSSSGELYLPSAKVTLFTTAGEMKIGDYTVTTEGTEVDLASGTYTTTGAYAGTVKVIRSANVSSIHTTTKIDAPQGTNKGYEHKDDYETKGEIGVFSPDGELKNENVTLKKIKGRGNSSWEASHELVGKYAFNITLDKKAKLLDESAKSKKYCLVSYNADQARMRNMFAYELAQQIGLAFSPDYEPVDFYNNGKYIGSYLLTDKVEIGDPLVDIVNLDDINEMLNTVDEDNGPYGTNYGLYDDDSLMVRASSNGIIDDSSTKGYYKYISNLEEPDPSEYAESGFLLEFELDERFPDEISGFISNKGQPIVSKYPEYATEKEIIFISNKWNAAEEVIYDDTATYEELDAVIDVESFAKMYLLQELSKNLDGGATSYYVFYDGGKFHAGVSWDFDWAFGQYGLSQSDKIHDSSDFIDKVDDDPAEYGGWYLNSKKIYNHSSFNAQAALCQNDNFWSVVVAEWDEVFYKEFSKFASSGSVSSASGLSGIIADFYNTTKATTILDETKWSIIANNPLSAWGSVNTGSTHEKAVVNFNNWVYNRVAWMDKYISTDGSGHTGIYDIDYVIQAPSISADNTAVTEGDTVTLTIEDKTDGDYTYKIYNGTTVVGTGTSFTADESGSYTVVAKSNTSGKESAASNAVAITVKSACDHVEEIIPAVDATCTETGLTEGKKCSLCGETLLAQETIDALGHKEEAITGKDATCTEEGLTEGKKCTLCGETLVAQEEIPALGHTEEDVAGKDATCTEKGLTEGKKCTVCGEVTVAQETIDALGHKEEAIAGKDATCTEKGLTEGKKCSLCGETLLAQETIDALGHKEEAIAGKDATCTETGLTEGKKCTVCGEVTVSQETIDALGHKEEAIAGKDATCTEKGLTEGKKCTVCGEITVAQETIDALGHKEEAIAGKDATCTEKGLTEGKKCTVCGEVTVAQEEIPALGHSWDNGSCTVCGQKKDLAEINGYTVSLGGEIGVNFYLTLTDKAAADAETRVDFTLPNGTVQSVSIADAVKTDKGYVFTCGVAAKEMTAVIKGQLFTSTGASSDVFKCCVKDYAEKILDGTEQEYIDAQPLVKAMLNYGAAAQMYFDYNTDTLANAGLKAEDKVVAEADFADYGYAITGKEEGVTYYGSRLTLEDETLIKHYFYITTDEIPEITVNDEKVKAEKKGDIYEVVIDGIVAQDLDEKFELKIGGLTLDYNAFSYGKLAAQGEDAMLINVMNALYAYNQVANQY